MQLGMFGRHADLKSNPRGRKNYSTVGQIHLPTLRPPGAGWQPIPHSVKGGFRRRRGVKWEYWYPDGNHGTHAAPREPEPTLEPESPKLQPEPPEQPKPQPEVETAPASAALEQLKAKYGLSDEDAAAVAKTADNLVRLGMRTDREQAMVAAGEAHAKKKGWKPAAGIRPAPKPKREPRPAPEASPGPERKREADPSRPLRREEVLAERGKDGRSVTSQTEKDARDWGEKIGGARKDIYDDLSSRQLEELEAQGGTAAFRAVTKDAVLGKHDPDYDQSLGLSPGASMIKRSIWKHIAPRPENTPGHRENYVAAAEWLRKMVDTKKSASEMKEFLTEWRETVRLERVPGPVIPVDEFIKTVGAEIDTGEARRRVAGYAFVHASDGTAYVYSTRAASEHGFVTADQSVHQRQPTDEEEAERKRHLEAWRRAPSNDPRGHEAYGKVTAMRERLRHGAPVQTYIRTPDVDRLKRYSKALGQRFETQLHDKTKGVRAALWVDASEAVQHDQGGGGWGPLEPKSGGGKGRSVPRSSHDFKPDVGGAQRVGPPVHGGASEQALTRDFGLRAGEFGRSVSDDIGDTHVQKSYEALSDLAEILGLERKQLSHGGQLAVAFGARGRGGARAHYESEKKVINITKNAAGSLAHEWGHFLDHIASREELVGDGGSKLRTTFSSHGEHAGKLPDQVRSAFTDVMAAIKHGGDSAGAERIRIANERFQEVRTSGGYGTEHVARLNAAMREVREANRAAPNIRRSEFAEHAAILGGYWERPHEMFARAFEAFVEDELAAKGRKSEYLVAGTAKRLNIQRAVTAKGKETIQTVEIYPHGNDRTTINTAMRRLFAAMSATGYLQKALGLRSAATVSA
jgi:hypothetical protein